MRNFAILAASGILATAVGQVLPQPSGETRSVRMLESNRSLVVESPQATKSRVWQTPTGKANRGAALAGRSFEISNRVILKTDDATAQQFAARHNGATRPLGVKGYWQIDVATVADAIELAASAAGDPQVAHAGVDTEGQLALRSVPTDPKFNLQWHLENTQQPEADVNIVPAWGAGYTGAGVVIGFLDSAIEVNHPEFAGGHVPEGSSHPGGPSGNPHGTSVTGVAVAAGNNGLMGAGSAYNAQFTTHLLSTNSATAAALAFRNDLNDVRNNSWGPLDIEILHKPNPAIMDAIVEAATDGRGGKGTVLVWAAGNGGVIGDRVDYDPYASSRYTLAVGSIGDLDTAAPYTERGSSVALVTQSDGNNRGIYTTSTSNGETAAFGGTSAAAPLASGVVALLLEARPDLHWRDVRAVLLDTARQCDPFEEGWQTNGAGRSIHYRYGFGAIDAGLAISVAEEWEPLGHELEVTSGTVSVNEVVPDRDATGVTIDVPIADDIVVETVEVILNVDSPYIGDLTVDLTAPSGTRSALARRRDSDGEDDLVDYVFTSFRSYGERSAGTWQVKLADRAPGDIATWLDVEVRVHGQPVCRLDLDQDGVYGLGDLQELLTGFGACSDEDSFNPAADDDNDGCTSLSDLARLLNRFGSSCD